MTPHGTELINLYDVCRGQLATGEQQLKAGEEDDVCANELVPQRDYMALSFFFYYFGLRCKKPPMLWKQD